MNRLKREKQIQVIAALVEGSSIRSTERMTGVHRDTIMRLLCRTGKHCGTLLDERMRDLPCQTIQADEIWTFVGKKKQHLTAEDRLNPELGDQYVFVALDADTKLIPVFTIGKRNHLTATRFMFNLQRRINHKVQITTDVFNAYIPAIEAAFGADADYAQLVKLYRPNGVGRGRYAPPDIVGVAPRVVNGKPDPEKISTSYVERQNLTMRMQMRRLTRLTNGYSKKLENLKAALNLHFAHYNFVRIHQSLRMPPAMKAGVVKHLWGIERLLP